MPGTVVDVTFPKGLVAVPDVVGKSYLQAKARIGAAGLVFSPQPAGATNVPAERQSPIPGTMVLPGSTVEVFFKQRMLKTPNVVGMGYDQAKKAIDAAGLVMHPHGDLKKGKVDAQNPPAGTPVTPGSAVDVTFTGGLATVPNVVGLKVAAAQQAITRAGLVISTHGDPNRGPAIQQAPAAGTKVEPGSRVEVTFPQGLVRVPNVVGLNLAAIQSTMQKAGLQLRIHGDPKTGPAVSQNPLANVEVAPGTIVDVAFPDGVTRVPNVVGAQLSLATKQIESAKLKAMVHGRVGKVFKQEPAAGAEVPIGSTVHLYVPDVNQVAVPNVIGMSDVLAAKTLTAEHLKMRITGDTKKGSIRTQSPAAGTVVNVNTEITVTILPELVQIPSVIGLSGPKASALLQQASLVMKTVGDPNLGPALKQDPKAGLKVSPGSTVTVYFREPGGERVVPNVIGLSLNDVRARLDAVGLKLLINGDPSAGNSVNQKPAAGTSVKMGTTVTVTFAGTGLVTVPNLVGMTYTQAKEALDAVKLPLKATPSMPGATILTQTPPAGAKVSPGTTVSVTFAAMVQVPNVINLSEHDAMDRVKASQLVPIIKGSPKAGRVVAQDPPAGTYVKPNTSVTLTFPTMRMVAIPNVVGMSYEQARSALLARKLVPAGAADSPADIVQAQNPTALTQVPEGSQVALKLSAVLVQVPSVVGLPLSQAMAKLSAAKLKGSIAGGDPKAGNVKGQDPPAGASVREGTTVRLTFPTPAQFFAVPNVIGMNRVGAQAAIESRGLKFQSATGKLGTATKQLPAAGTMVQPGATVTVTFQEGPSLVTVPNVKGMNYQTAKKTLEAMGLHLSTSGDIKKGRVQTQTPSAGAQVPRGATVSLIFANPMMSERPAPPGWSEEP